MKSVIQLSFCVIDSFNLLCHSRTAFAGVLFIVVVSTKERWRMCSPAPILYSYLLCLTVVVSYPMAIVSFVTPWAASSYSSACLYISNNDENLAEVNQPSRIIVNLRILSTSDFSSSSIARRLLHAATTVTLTFFFFLCNCSCSGGSFLAPFSEAESIVVVKLWQTTDRPKLNNEHEYTFIIMLFQYFMFWRHCGRPSIPSTVHTEAKRSKNNLSGVFRFNVSLIGLINCREQITSWC